MHIRPEQSTDIEQIRKVNTAAFPTDAEANLVDSLRSAGIKLISLVAEENNQIIGHILFSPVTIEPESKIKLIGLAPMAVLPDRQRQGIGTQLVNEGLKVCTQAGYEAVVVLGHPDYYPRFGFEPSTNFGIQSEYNVPAGVFMVKELQPGVLSTVSGTVKYHPLFNDAW
ncbi:MAG: N-acetyltransferase [Gammaproteobacteria bacterium]|nr:N-acetyltransferase [Gammaproteobacteria bacterium]